MSDSKINSKGSLSEIQGKFSRVSKATKKASAASRAIAKFRKAKGLLKRATTNWLRDSVKIRKMKPTSDLSGMKRVKVSPSVGRTSLGGMKRATPSFQTAEWNGIELIPVISSNVASYGYDEEDMTLIVAFTDGSIYEYYNVPEGIWWRFQVAPSKGRFVWSDLRDKFMYERVA